MKNRFFALSLFIIYMFAVTAVMVWQGIGITPDRYAFVLLLASLLVKRTRSFLLDWLPFLFLLISYDFLRSMVGAVSERVNYFTPIQADEKIFGTLPTVSLQQLLFNAGSPSWYDYLTTIVYFLHFALPLTFAFLVWTYNKNYFHRFVTGILVLSYTAWLTYFIFPAAPPWLAQQQGYIDGVNKIMNVTLASFPTKLDLPSIYHNFNPNPVAAVPSLHAGYVFLVFLFAWRFFKYRAIFFFPYVLLVWFTIIYLGEHYVFDIIIGVIYALGAYLLSEKVLHGFDWSKATIKISHLKKQWLNT